MLADKNYYTWVDYAKFLSIFLVVFFHSPPDLTGFSEIFLNLIRMPMFFFLSGLLFKREKYNSFFEFVKHRSRQLLIPYFCFFVIFYTYWLIYGKNHGNQEDLDATFYQPILEYLYGVPNLVCKPLWFVPCLFAIQCIFYLLFKKMNRKYASVLLLLFPLVPFYIDISNAPFSLENVCQGIAFYGIASLYRKKIIDFIKNKHLFLTMIFVISSILYIILVNLVMKLEFSVWNFAIKTIASFVIIIPILILMKYLSDLFGRQLLIEKFASNAIIILAFHTYSIIALQKAVNINPQNLFQDCTFIYKLFISVISTISMIIPIWFINKYAPFILGKRKIPELKIK